MISFHITSIWQLERTEAWLQKKLQRGLLLDRVIGPFYKFSSTSQADRSSHYWMEFYDTGSQSGAASLFLERYRGNEIRTLLSFYSIYSFISNAQREEELVSWRKDRFRHARTAMIQRLVLTVIVAVLLVVRFSGFVTTPIGVLCMLLLLAYILYNIVGLSFVAQRISS